MTTLNDSYKATIDRLLTKTDKDHVVAYTRSSNEIIYNNELKNWAGRFGMKTVTASVQL